MDQALALEIMSAGESVLLTGPAGSGKTYVLNEFIRQAKRDGKYVSVTATTGLAATHLNGNTIHSWSGIGIHEELPDSFFDNLLKSRRDTIEKTDVLIIDEVSMLHDYRLDMIDEIVRTVREVDEPFGGIQVILCGDFFQLPPVTRSDSRPGGFVVGSLVWQTLDPVICYLNEQHRQNDDTLLEILSAMRDGDVRRRHAEALLERCDAQDMQAEVTELHTTNVDVDAINDERLRQLDGDVYSFAMDTSGKSNYVDTLKKSCLAQEVLTLKKGALVMCIRNNLEKKYVNGTLGVVEGFEENTNYPIVRLRNGRKITIEPDTWELMDGDKKRAALTQIPLRLAWAITIHKSQGMTLDAARIDLRKAFVDGMGYVALSRVRSLDTLSLAGINKKALRVSQDALSIDESLRLQSRKAVASFEYLRQKAQGRNMPPQPVAKSNIWVEKVTNMRIKYPNAYKPWKESDDKRLVEMFSSGVDVSIDDLTKVFGRHPGSIRARLKKHFGEDAVISHKK
ncbi:AAA family ATPase [Candidatus Saccharibacteria bacterium]|nr:AAA family ATPase [Candidatus Saccharibacteria bacterium]